VGSHELSVSGWNVYLANKFLTLNVDGVALIRGLAYKSRQDILVAVPRFKCAQLILRHAEFRESTIYADKKLGEYPNDRLFKIFHSGEMDAQLPGEPALVG
jgi:hypothetical protein